MTPRSKIFSIDINETSQKNIDAIIDSGYTRIPVFQDKTDNIIGILNIKHLFRQIHTIEDLKLSEFTTKPCFVPNTYRISELLKKFQKEKMHMAIITDEHGDVDGLVTIEDILEEIVGDIDDESDEETRLISRLKEGGYLVDGSVSIVDFNRHFKTDFPEDEQFTTVSGLLLDKLEKIPEIGTKTTIENIEFTINEPTERTIKSVKVKKIRKE